MTLGPARNGRWRQLRGDVALLLAGLGLALVVWFVITDSENEPIEERLGFELADVPFAPGRHHEAAEYRVRASDADEHEVIVVARNRRHARLNFITMLEQVIEG